MIAVCHIVYKRVVISPTFYDGIIVCVVEVRTLMSKGGDTMKFEMPEMIELFFNAEEKAAFGPEDCSAKWKGGCCYKE